MNYSGIVFILKIFQIYDKLLSRSDYAFDIHINVKMEKGTSFPYIFYEEEENA